MNVEGNPDYAGSPETCNGLDDDCDASTDEGIAPRACGSGVCEGNQTCSGGAWSDCSSSGQDGGTCALCDANGSQVYDGTQDSDCNEFDLEEVSTCFFNPDGADCTLDYSPGFNSECSGIGSCTLGSYDFSHTCNKASCAAECESDTDCSGQNEYCRKSNDCECRVKGDVKIDNSVNVLDLATVGRAYNSQSGEQRYNADADVDPLGDGDGMINGSDMAVVVQNYGT